MKNGIAHASGLLAAAAFLLSAPVYADDDNAATTQEAPAQNMPVQDLTREVAPQNAPVQGNAPPMQDYDSSRELPMVSGGVGDSDEMALSQQQNRYNLKLLFTEGNGMYLSDVQVHITNMAGLPVANTVTNGPILLVRLPAGKYNVTASSEGETRQQKISVGSGLRTYQFRYPTRDAED